MPSNIFFYPGEPNNPDDEDCMDYEAGNFPWFDANCRLGKGGICEAHQP